MINQPNSQSTVEEEVEQQASADASDAQQEPVGDVVIRERKKKRKRKKKQRKSKRRFPLAAKVILIIVAVLAVIGLGFCAFLQYNIHKGNEQLHVEHPDVAETGTTVNHDGHTYKYNNNVVAILVLGKDDESRYGTNRSCTDANMLVTLDTETKNLNILAIQRDAMVDVDLYEDGQYTYTAEHQLAVAYGVDVSDDDAAAHNSMKSVSKLLYNLPVNRYFTLEMNAVAELSTAVGGVMVEALDVYPGADFEVGDTVLLQGQSALRYVQYRDINIDKSAQDRQARQMQFVKAFIEKLRTLDAGTLLDLYNTVQQTTYTNLELSDITYLISVFLDGKSATTSFTAIEGDTLLETDDDGVEREHVYLYEDSVMDAALAAFYTLEE